MCLCKEKTYPSFTCNLLYDLSGFIQNKDYVHSNIVYLMDFRVRYRDLYYLLTILHNMVAKSIRKHTLPGFSFGKNSWDVGVTKDLAGNLGTTENNSENPVVRPFSSSPQVSLISFESLLCNKNGGKLNVVAQASEKEACR